MLLTPPPSLPEFDLNFGPDSYSPGSSPLAGGRSRGAHAAVRKHPVPQMSLKKEAAAAAGGSGSGSGGVFVGSAGSAAKKEVVEFDWGPLPSFGSAPGKTTTTTTTTSAFVPFSFSTAAKK